MSNVVGEYYHKEFAHMNKQRITEAAPRGQSSHLGRVMEKLRESQAADQIIQTLAGITRPLLRFLEDKKTSVIADVTRQTGEQETNSTSVDYLDGLIGDVRSFTPRVGDGYTRRMLRSELQTLINNLNDKVEGRGDTIAQGVQRCLEDLGGIVDSIDPADDDEDEVPEDQYPEEGGMEEEPPPEEDEELGPPPAAGGEEEEVDDEELPPESDDLAKRLQI